MVLWRGDGSLSDRQSYWSKPDTACFEHDLSVILFQPHLFTTKPSYLRIYKEFSVVYIKLFKFLAEFFANSHFLSPITKQANEAEKKAVGDFMCYVILCALIVLLTSNNNKPKFSTESEINLDQSESYTNFNCVKIIPVDIPTALCIFLSYRFSKRLTYSVCQVHKALCTKL